MKKAGLITIGIAALLAAGALTGVLFAPDKGERIRRKIARKGRRYFRATKDAMEEGKDSLEAFRDQLKDNLEGVETAINRLVKSEK